MKKILLIMLSCLIAINIFAQTKQIKLAADEWSPYYSSEGGYLSEITVEAFKAVGYNCTITYLPWKRVLEESKIGNYDGILGAFYNKDREQFYKYSNKIGESNICFYSRLADNITYKTLNDLSKFKIGTIRGYSYSDEFDKATYLTKDEVTDINQNMLKLVNGRIDLFIESKEVVNFTLKNSLSNKNIQIKQVNPVYVVNPLYVLITKNNKSYQQIINDFNKGLDLIKTNGTYDKIIKKWIGK